ncbi:M23 family metallopeptidase [Bacillus timonensis]|nr:M23 family metallopeptidase [Bacillus timonensis]
MREEEKKRTSQNQSSKMQQFFRKRWVFPAIYLASAAIILTAVLWYQSLNNEVADPGKKYGSDNLPGVVTKEEPNVPVNATVENFAMPVLDKDAVEIFKQFYDVDASAEEQEAALVFYDNTYYQSRGLDIVAKDGKEFDVVASLSGTVTKVAKDPLFGNMVEIEHSNGVVTVYQSLSNVKVKEGDTVKQGQILAKAGKNVFNQEAATHVHFEVRNSEGKALNPLEFFDKPLTSVEDSEGDTEKKPSEDEKKPAEDDEKTNDEDSNDEDSSGASVGQARA